MASDEEIIARDMHPVLARWFLQADAEICEKPSTIGKIWTYESKPYVVLHNGYRDPYTERTWVDGAWVDDEVLQAKRWPEHVSRILHTESTGSG